MSEQPELHLLKLENLSIYEQLQLEEAILRTDTKNWCLINIGSLPAIVMGISGKVERFVDVKKHSLFPIPIVKRFSGGGTVVVDEKTLFVTWIINQKDVNIPVLPATILKWTETIYSPLFSKDCRFQVKENDYVLGEKKCGGNAQYLQKNRWLHHSTLLWEYDEKKMDLLHFPPKVPEYRGRRTHQDFLCCLKEHFSSFEDLSDGLIQEIGHHFKVKKKDYVEAEQFLTLPHRKSTQIIF